MVEKLTAGKLDQLLRSERGIKLQRKFRKRKTLLYELETFNDMGMELNKNVRGEGWKQKGLCIILPSPKKGVNQTLFISAEALRAFVKSMPR